ncbi:xylose isomerase [Pedobacter yonginense]|uniref:Xylose isomerase n=1 Tax=Pedobacter yonginense TaxID=651869 RepID=A0A317EK50_9SPHI|nr:sugar phosphate isomerase/epimerase [Pedobacter yonginense]PWS27042.1 xylose isomerase [Pedobacter yonginense]
MKIKVLATQWGSGSWSASYFLDYVKANDYAGIEINMPQDQQYVSEFLLKLDEIRATEDFTFVGQAVLAYQNEGFQDHLKRYKRRLEEVILLKPDFINVQTGTDFFSFDENCAFIECALELSEKNDVKIIHETHRGKFSFHSLKTLEYLEKFPELELTADLSHWCNVSESLLVGQDEILDKIFPRVRHVHARIGFAQASQVNHFMAPEWTATTAQFLHWWKQILEANEGKEFTFLTEFGPQPYLPSLPFSGVPVADQWELNLKMKDFLLQNL